MGRMEDLLIPPGPGAPRGVLIPASELSETFSHASGPGGQGVNTSDSRVQLSFNVAGSGSFTPAQRARLLEVLGSRLTDGSLTLAAQEHRSQCRNRAAARTRLAELLREALVPPLPRRATKPTRGSQRRRLEAKKQRSDVKANRRRPSF
jgi:ribosome-associated protein